MIATQNRTASSGRRRFEPAAPPAPAPIDERPIVAAVEPETAAVTAATAARLARELRAPLTFVTVRPRTSPLLGEPYYQRRLTRDVVRGRNAIDQALAEATRRGVMAHGEIVEGDAPAQILRFASDRRARLLVLGRRARRLRRSVSRRVIAAADRPVVVAARRG